ncbi:MAG: hypothetical protein JNM94_04100 [Phycisphaerae bacterium]|nr:hypothetical protein [Phycisphaerae bacterium]
MIAIVLSLATLTSTWCGYQSRAWGSIAGSHAGKADTSERQAAENTIVALQVRTQDGLILLEYWRALRTGDEKTAEIALSHMPERLRVAVKAALADGILKDPSVPGPMHRAEYVIEEERKAADERAAAKSLHSTAHEAGGHSDAYVLLTLMFASILFFGGISGTFSTKGIRMALASVAMLLFAIAVSVLFTLPVA